MSGSMRDALMQAMQQRQAQAGAPAGGEQGMGEDPMAELAQAISAVVQLLTALGQNLQNPQVAGMLQQLSQASQQPAQAPAPQA
jgi:hypothetical protein